MVLQFVCSTYDQQYDRKRTIIDTLNEQLIFTEMKCHRNLKCILFFAYYLIKHNAKKTTGCIYINSNKALKDK